MPLEWSLTATPLSASDHFRCTRPRSLLQRHNATTPFQRHLRLFAPSRSFTTRPPPPMQRPVPPSVRLFWRSLSHSHPALHAAEPLTLPPDPSLIPVSADNITRQVRVVRPTLSHALNQRSAAELFHACDSPSHRARLLSLQCRHAGACLDHSPDQPVSPPLQRQLHQRLPLPPWSY
jgi:hypothetical protein